MCTLRFLEGGDEIVAYAELSSVWVDMQEITSRSVNYKQQERIPPETRHRRAEPGQIPVRSDPPIPQKIILFIKIG